MSHVGRAFETLRDEGIPSTFWRARKWLRNKRFPMEEKPLSSVFSQDVLAVDWVNSREFAPQPLVSSTGRPQVAWIISAPSKSSGGHQNAFRFMKFLEDAGYDLTLLIYSSGKYPRVTVRSVRRVLASNSAYPQLKASIEIYNPATGLVGDFDLIVASDWPTAYAAWRYERDVPRFYFVQDFEPYFYPLGSDYVAAENSYRLGYHALTVGPWLARKLSSEYGMPADFFDFAVDSSRYRRTNDDRRVEIVFYARPTTPRRATEFGLMVLAVIARDRPDIVINIFGADLPQGVADFPFVNLGTLDTAELSAVFNRCAVGFSLSMTNVSLFPLEAMACGAVPVLNDNDCTRIALNDIRGAEFLPMSPELMARKIIAIVDREDQVEHSRSIADSTHGLSWNDSGEKMVRVIKHVMGRAH